MQISGKTSTSSIAWIWSLHTSPTKHLPNPGRPTCTHRGSPPLHVDSSSGIAILVGSTVPSTSVASTPSVLRRFCRRSDKPCSDGTVPHQPCISPCTPPGRGRARCGPRRGVLRRCFGPRRTRDGGVESVREPETSYLLIAPRGNLKRRRGLNPDAQITRVRFQFLPT